MGRVMKMMSLARCFKTFSQCGRDSWMSSRRTPPSPFRSCCFSNLKRLFPSLILYIGLNWKRPSVCSSFGLLGKASVSSHYEIKALNLYFRDHFTAHCLSRWSNIELICLIEDFFNRQRVIRSSQVTLLHVIDDFRENGKSLLGTSGHSLVAHRLLRSGWFWFPWC